MCIRDSSRAGRSEVEATTTERLNPSGPRSLRIKSPTSRPLSPIKAITLTSARPWRAIIPKRVLLPTPLPEKMPTLWPSPQVSKLSIAFTPVSYTHLDVYKRQSLPCLEKTRIRSSPSCGGLSASLISAGVSPLSRKSVSYTHLLAEGRPPPPLD